MELLFFVQCYPSALTVLLIASPLMLVLVSAGHDGVVDDEIWHHVSKVLSDHEGGKKVLLSHPEPAHLVDAYTKVYHHEPYYHHDHVYDNHLDHHDHHDDHHHQHQHLSINPHHYHHAPPHVHHAPTIFRIPTPVFSTIRYGPPPPPPHHHYHFRK